MKLTKKAFNEGGEYKSTDSILGNRLWYVIEITKWIIDYDHMIEITKWVIDYDHIIDITK